MLRALNLTDCTTPAQIKKFQKVQAYYKDHPINADNFASLFDTVVGVPHYVTLGELIASDSNNEVTQYPVVPAEVLDILAGEYALIEGHPIYESIVVGFKDDNLTLVYDYLEPVNTSLLEITSGRHRTTAAATVVELSGLTLTEAWDWKVPVVYKKYSPALVKTGNSSRPVKACEKSLLKLQESDISGNPEDICKAAEIGTIKHQIAAANCFSIWGQEFSTGLAGVTLHDIGYKLISLLKQSHLSHPVQSAEYLAFLKEGFDILPEAVEKCKSVGITNIARGGVVTIAEYLVAHYRQKAVEERKAKLAAKSTTPATTKAPAKPKATKSKAPTAKSTATEAA